MRNRLGKMLPVLALVMVLVYPTAMGVSRMLGWVYTLRSALVYVLICLILVFATLFFTEEQTVVGRTAALLVFLASCISGYCLHIGCESAWVSHCVLALVIVSIVLFAKTKMTWKIKLRQVVTFLKVIKTF